MEIIRANLQAPSSVAAFYTIITNTSELANTNNANAFSLLTLHNA